MTIGSGIPSSHNNAPLPRPMVATSIVCVGEVTAQPASGSVGFAGPFTKPPGGV
jgi:hypothetical protein